MKDVIYAESGADLGVANSVIPKAANILSVQIGSLDYAPEFGVDKRYFLETPVLFQNESLKAHFVERLSFYQINVGQVVETFREFLLKYTFKVNQEFDPFNRFTARQIAANVLTDADGVILTDADGAPLLDVF